MSALVLFASNPFFDAYRQSDMLGRLIFLSLIFLSALTWSVLIYKAWLTKKVRDGSLEFQRKIEGFRQNPLGFDVQQSKGEVPTPYVDLYVLLKARTLEILNKNRQFGTKDTSYLSPTDIGWVGSHLVTSIASHTKGLERNLYILSTIVTLAPFLGLLGTVWGILTTFSELQVAVGSTNQMVLGGLSLALATTVLGLLDAIPALIGYNYLRNAIRHFKGEMEAFSTEILAAVELQYRQIDVAH